MRFALFLIGVGGLGVLRLLVGAVVDHEYERWASPLGRFLMIRADRVFPARATEWDAELAAIQLDGDAALSFATGCLIGALVLRCRQFGQFTNAQIRFRLEAAELWLFDFVLKFWEAPRLKGRFRTAYVRTVRASLLVQIVIAASGRSGIPQRIGGRSPCGRRLALELNETVIVPMIQQILEPQTGLGSLDNQPGPSLADSSEHRARPPQPLDDKAKVQVTDSLGSAQIMIRTVGGASGLEPF
jgi:hypothetical protein